MKRSPLKIAIYSLTAVLCLLFVSVYGALRSTYVIQRHLIPFISNSAGVPISIDEIDISPFTGISLKGLRYNCGAVGTSCPSDRPLSIFIPSLELRYALLSLSQRELHITSLHCKGIKISVSTTKQSVDLPVQDTQNAPAEPSTSAEGSLFLIKASDVVIEDGFFSFEGADGTEMYKLDNLAIRIPHGESHGHSNISVDSRVSIQTPSLSFSNQEISLSGNLSQSEMFKPTVLDLKASAGPPDAPLLDLTAQLTFSKNPYTLKRISLSQSTIREGLLKALSIHTEPLREFEYRVKGEYAFSSPAEISADIEVKKNIFSGSKLHDLKGSRVSSTFLVSSDSIGLSKGAFEVFDNGSPILTTTALGDIAFDPYKQSSSLSLNARFADFGALRALASEISSDQESPSKQTSEEDSKIQTEHARDHKERNNNLKLPLGRLQILVDKAVIQGQETSRFRVDIKTPNARSIEKAEVEAAFVKGGAVSAHLAGCLDDKLSFKAQAREVNMIPFAALAAGPHGEILEGSLKSADVNLTARGADIRRTLDGDATIKISRLVVPSTLQQQVPFNILFIPLDALITVFGGTLNLLLPASISSISDSIRETLDDAGRLGLDASTVDLKFERGKILLKNVDINTKNLPDFTFKGSISAEDRLDLTVFMGLLKLNLPLPIAGTLQSPLPDVVYLGPELVRGLGLSVGNLFSETAR